MAELLERLETKIPQWRTELQQLLQHAGEEIVSHISLAQLFKGLRGVHAVICDTSVVDPVSGLYIREIPVDQLIDHSPEEIFFLLCTGELPDSPALAALQADLRKRAAIPGYVWEVLSALPKDTHPMTMLSVATLAMGRESVFNARYAVGMSRQDHWRATLEDALNLIARLPVIAGGIYRHFIRNRPLELPESTGGYTDHFAQLLGTDDDSGTFREFLRRFIIVHSDHEGANASVLTGRIVNSTWSDLYFSLSGAMNCLAGPLHGLANQDSVKFALEIRERFGGVPASTELENFIRDRLAANKVIPGFGHAVLRDQDPRYLILQAVGREACPDDPLFQISERLAAVVPPLLKEQGKAKNPYPNIDGISGILLYHFGIRELSFYTVMFSVAQSLGLCAQLVLARALNFPIFRPKSVTTAWLQQQFNEKTK